jgi:hypothetical protein
MPPGEGLGKQMKLPVTPFKGTAFNDVLIALAAKLLKLEDPYRSLRTLVTSVYLRVPRTEMNFLALPQNGAVCSERRVADEQKLLLLPCPLVCRCSRPGAVKSCSFLESAASTHRCDPRRPGFYTDGVTRRHCRAIRPYDRNIRQ